MTARLILGGPKHGEVLDWPAENPYLVVPILKPMQVHTVLKEIDENRPIDVETFHYHAEIVRVGKSKWDVFIPELVWSRPQNVLMEFVMTKLFDLAWNGPVPVKE